MNGPTDEWTEIFLIQQDFVPYWGHCLATLSLFKYQRGRARDDVFGRLVVLTHFITTLVRHFPHLRSGSHKRILGLQRTRFSILTLSILEAVDFTDEPKAYRRSEILVGNCISAPIFPVILNARD